MVQYNKCIRSLWIKRHCGSVCWLAVGTELMGAFYFPIGLYIPCHHCQSLFPGNWMSASSLEDLELNRDFNGDDYEYEDEAKLVIFPDHYEIPLPNIEELPALVSECAHALCLCHACWRGVSPLTFFSILFILLFECSDFHVFLCLACCAFCSLFITCSFVW